MQECRTQEFEIPLEPSLIPSQAFPLLKLVTGKGNAKTNGDLQNLWLTILIMIMIINKKLSLKPWKQHSSTRRTTRRTQHSYATCCQQRLLYPRHWTVTMEEKEKKNKPITVIAAIIRIIIVVLISIVIIILLSPKNPWWSRQDRFKRSHCTFRRIVYSFSLDFVLNITIPHM